MNEVRPQQSMGQPMGQKPLIGGAPLKIAAPPSMPAGQHGGDDEAINLIGDHDGGTESKIRANVGSGPSVRKDQFVRKPSTNGTGSCRLRTFHGRLSSQGLEYMDNQVNEWLDQHPEVEVKFVTSTVGVFEGKMREPALILNLWY